MRHRYFVTSFVTALPDVILATTYTPCFTIQRCENDRHASRSADEHQQDVFESPAVPHIERAELRLAGRRGTRVPPHTCLSRRRRLRGTHTLCLSSLLVVLTAPLSTAFTIVATSISPNAPVHCDASYPPRRRTGEPAVGAARQLPKCGVIGDATSSRYGRLCRHSRVHSQIGFLSSKELAGSETLVRYYLVPNVLSQQFEGSSAI